jgi:hypothetical protein
MPTQFAMDDSMSGVCRNCGHKVRNHFAASSPVMKRCLEKGCKCDWAWNGDNDTTAVDRGTIGIDGHGADLSADQEFTQRTSKSLVENRFH